MRRGGGEEGGRLGGADPRKKLDDVLVLSSFFLGVEISSSLVYLLSLPRVSAAATVMRGGEPT
jgi:hypothetical protein